MQDVFYNQLPGLVLSTTALGTERRKENAKVAVFQYAVEAAGTETSGSVVIPSAEDMKNLTRGEENRMHDFLLV